MRNSPHFDQLFKAYRGEMFPDLLERNHENRFIPTQWQQQLLQLRERRIAIRNLVMTPSVLTKIDQITLSVEGVRFSGLRTYV
jgi:hypothetical protein